VWDKRNTVQRLGQVSEGIADRRAGAAVRYGGGEAEPRVRGDQAQQFAAHVTAGTQYDGRD
jgi:hypothetical protein